MGDVSGRAWAVDARVPNLARMYDYWLGGKDNFAADRQAAGRLAAAIPQLPLLAMENRKFLGRAVRFCVGAGVTQFLDIGSGLPTAENVHEAAGHLDGQSMRGVRGQRPSGGEPRSGAACDGADPGGPR